jgi:hypothetical protein
MEGIDKPHTGKYKEITNDWNYDASCTLTSLPVWDFENFKRLIFVVQNVRLVVFWPGHFADRPRYFPFKLRSRFVKLSSFTLEKEHKFQVFENFSGKIFGTGEVK